MKEEGVLPPEPETKKEKRDAQLEVVKAHVKEVVISERETEPGIHILSFLTPMDSIKKIKESKRHHAYRNRQKDLFRHNRWEHVKECRQHNMGQPVRENRDIQFPSIPHLIVFVFSIFFQH